MPEHLYRRRHQAKYVVGKSDCHQVLASPICLTDVLHEVLHAAADTVLRYRAA